MTATVFGTGALHAMAIKEQPAPAPRLVVSERENGFRAVLDASPEAFRAVRALTRSMPTRHGIALGLGEVAELVVSELTGNVVRASSNGSASLVVEVYAIPPGIEVIVHDTVLEQPRRQEVALDSADAESGRGMALLDLLTDHWSVEPSPEPSFTKLIRCRISSAA
ncbi:ATP-binding protein [Streptomyces griseomycini]|uniref:Anti-sigma regulatory factor (Ser/Thr protein kinase) n=1 Tax=Streptomyces griseomycini TaxID=66895 RepID=A0A7W7PXW4_9ACTN|nr:ATP-binding protein [Streptomyces griseomycini]MBB4903309.1 anti-sigma regulatory factor (Ser/Thr protein kinase) [Streptomyces griseomycini]GGR43586.1 hypothetical protein GCM10015536_56930 [Streptomyces griseomycini]